MKWLWTLLTLTSWFMIFLVSNKKPLIKPFDLGKKPFFPASVWHENKAPDFVLHYCLVMVEFPNMFSFYVGCNILIYLCNILNSVMDVITTWLFFFKFFWHFLWGSFICSPELISAWSLLCIRLNCLNRYCRVVTVNSST